MKKLILLPLVLLFGCIESGDDLADLDIDVAKNIPVISNLGNVYSLVLSADNFSLLDQATVEMDSSLVLSLTVADYSSGNLHFSVYGGDSSVVFDRDITSNMVFSEILSASARSLNVELQDFSGKITLSLVED